MTTVSQLNGVDVTSLVATVNAVKSQLEIARFQFRARNTWQSGGYSQTTIQSFYGAGKEDDTRPAPFMIPGDEPPVLLGTNKAPNAVELVLSAIASCLAVGVAYNGAAQGIRIDRLEFDLEGDLDLQGFLGLSSSVRPGFNDIRVKVTAESDAPRAKLDELLAYVQQTSPVLDIVRNPVPVSVTLA